MNALIFLNVGVVIGVIAAVVAILLIIFFVSVE